MWDDSTAKEQENFPEPAMQSHYQATVQLELPSKASLSNEIQKCHQFGPTKFSIASTGRRKLATHPIRISTE
jgi:hypothetical protein